MYDVLLHLKPEQQCCHHLAVDINKDCALTKYGEVPPGGDEDNHIPVVGFNPTQKLMEELQVIIKFYDHAKVPP